LIETDFENNTFVISYLSGRGIVIEGKVEVNAKIRRSIFIHSVMKSFYSQSAYFIDISN